MYVRALRGATTIDNNTKDEIFSASQEMIKKLIDDNEINIDDIASIIFSVTPDIDAAFPAASVRKMGISNVPLLDVAQPQVDGALKMCIRVIIHFNTEKNNEELKHAYLRGAKILRPDLIK